MPRIIFIRPDARPHAKQQTKALLEINGERLTERQITQLREVGVQDIYVMVGFMKEQFDYLAEAFDVT